MEKMMDAVAVRVDEYGTEVGKKKACEVFRHGDHLDIVFGANGSPIRTGAMVHDFYMGIELNVRGKYYYVQQR